MTNARDTLEEQLAAAIVFGHVDLVRELIKAGVNITADEHEAVHLAARHGRADILPLLLVAGGQLYYTGGHDLEAAVARGFTGVVRLMLDHLKPTPAAGQRALRAAVSYGRPEMVAWLRDAGVPVPLGRRAAWLKTFASVPPDVQVALLASGGPVRSQSIVALARKGLAPEAIFAALARRPSNADLLAVLQATQALENLSPDERADLLHGLLDNKRRAYEASAVAAPR